MKIETQAVNTKGLWYAMVLINGKVVYQGKEGFVDRADAVENGKTWSRQAHEFPKEVFEGSIFGRKSLL